MIPKIIHQTWKNKTIPEAWKEAVESVKEKHKNYKYILWTDESMKQFVKKEFPDFYKTYNAYEHHIQRCDAFRFLVLYVYGGIYIDMDIMSKKSLNPLLKYDIVFVKQPYDNSFTNAFIACIPSHPFIQYCINKLPEYKDSYSFFGKHVHVMNSTGPYFLKKMVEHYKAEKHTLKNHYILTKEEYSGDCTSCTFDTCKGGTYFKHIAGQSWHSYDSTLYVNTYCFLKQFF